MERVVLDLGSHSAKAYHQTTSQLVCLQQVTWQLLETELPSCEIEEILRRLAGEKLAQGVSVYAIGTEAMRRNPLRSIQMKSICERLQIRYRTLSQEEEAELILAAFPGDKNLDIINVGGGSIQIVSAISKKLSLIDFGVSDLNKFFRLNDSPNTRHISECMDWIYERLPTNLKAFIYTGGELTYLKNLGVPLQIDRCCADDFKKMAERLSLLSLAELKSLSPHDPNWMTGATASNCIVIAALRRARSKEFIASDSNIAHGLCVNYQG